MKGYDMTKDTTSNATPATFTFARPAPTPIRNVSGSAIRLDWSKVNDSIAREVMLVGAKTILTNVWNGGGKDATDKERLSKLEGKLAAWYRGEFAIATRGESGYGAMRAQYVDERRAATGQTQKEVDATIKATVEAVFGKDETATFSRFLDAAATLKSKDGDGDFEQMRDAIEAGLAERAAKAEAERAKVVKEVKIDAASLGF